MFEKKNGRTLATLSRDVMRQRYLGRCLKSMVSELSNLLKGLTRMCPQSISWPLCDLGHLQASIPTSVKFMKGGFLGPTGEWMRWSMWARRSRLPGCVVGEGAPELPRGSTGTKPIRDQISPSLSSTPRKHSNQNLHRDRKTQTWAGRKSFHAPSWWVWHPADKKSLSLDPEL